MTAPSHPPSSQNWRPQPIDWQVSQTPVGYAEAVSEMEAHVENIIAGTAAEKVWLLEHPPLYTGGTSAKQEDLKDPHRFPVFKTRRGGQYTYHGPGQRVAYVMLDLRKRHQDIRQYITDLEKWIINTLSEFNVYGEVRPDRVGVWVNRSQPGVQREDKIAAIGVRIKKWVTFHGIALNVEPDLSHFEGITPCGIQPTAFGVTSLVDLGLPVTMEEVDAALAKSFTDIFGPLSI
ncbi:MAG: lipoyl(octanoyl) transferase LipB [Pseudomonadota bacterium]